MPWAHEPHGSNAHKTRESAYFGHAEDSNDV